MKGNSFCDAARGQPPLWPALADSGLSIQLRQSKYLNNLVEQDHRAVKRVVRPMLGCKSMHIARILEGNSATPAEKPAQPNSLPPRRRVAP